MNRDDIHPSVWEGGWEPAYVRDPERYARLGELYKTQAEARAAERDAALAAWEAEVARLKADDQTRAAEAKAAEDRAAEARLAQTLSVLRTIGFMLLAAFGLVAFGLILLAMIVGHGP